MLPVKPLAGACFPIKLSARDGKRETGKKYTRTLINYETFLQSEKMNGKFILKGNERGRGGRDVFSGEKECVVLLFYVKWDILLTCV